MKMIWKLVNPINVTVSVKIRLFLFMMIAANSVAGALAWAILGRIILSGTSWFICFIGYPAIFVGFFGGALYLYNHEFK